MEGTKKFFLVSWQMKNAATIYPAEGGRSQLLALMYLLWEEKKSCSYSNWILIVQSAITQLTSENSTKEDLTQYKRVDVQEYMFASVNQNISFTSILHHDSCILQTRS